MRLHSPGEATCSLNSSFVFCKATYKFSHGSLFMKMHNGFNFHVNAQWGMLIDVCEELAASSVCSHLMVGQHFSKM